MKNKLLALTLAFLMIFATIPAGAIGMMGVETAEEIGGVVPTIEEADLSAAIPEKAILFEDFETKTVGDSIASGASAPFTYTYGSYTGNIIGRTNNGGASDLAGAPEIKFVQDPTNEENTVGMITMQDNAQASRWLGFELGHEPLHIAGDVTISFRYYIEGTISNATQYVSVCVASQNTVNGTDKGHMRDLVAGQWYDFSYTHNVAGGYGKYTSNASSTGLRSFRPILNANGCSGDIKIYYDDIAITYTAADKSIDTPQSIGMKDNVLLYEDFTNADSYLNQAVSYAKPGYDAIRDIGWGNGKPTSWEIVKDSDDSSNNVLKTSIAQGGYGLLFSLAPATPYTNEGVYTLSFDYKVGPSIRGYIYSTDVINRNTINGNVTDVNVKNRTTWRSYTHSITLKEGEELNFVQFSGHAQEGPLDFYIDNITVEYGPVVGTTAEAGKFDNILVYEDFTNNTSYAGNASYVKPGYEASFRNDGALDGNGVPARSIEDGVLKVTPTGGWQSIFRLVPAEKITTPGKYILSFKLKFSESGKNHVIHDYSNVNGARSETKTYYTTSTDWVTYTHEITITSGQYIGDFQVYAYDKDGDYTYDIYIDDITVKVPYKAIATGYFATAGGVELGSMENIDEAETYTLPYNYELGLDYEVKYTDENGSVYYPGMERPLVDGEEDINFTVSADDGVIFFQDLDDATSTPEIATGEAIDATSPYTSDRGHLFGTIDNRKTLKANISQWNGIEIANGLNISSEGVYTVSYDVYLDNTGSNYNTENSFNIYLLTYGASDSTDDDKAEIPGTANINDHFSAGEWATVTQSFVIQTETEEGEHYGKKYYMTGKDAKCYLDKTDSEGIIPSIKLVVDAKFGLNGGETGVDIMPTIYFDNFTIEYTAIEPTTLDYVQLRTESPEGIRFASYVTESQRKNSVEYGYLVGLATDFEGKDDFNLDNLIAEKSDEVQTLEKADGRKIIAAAAYAVDGCDRVYARDGSVFGSELAGCDEIFFTGVIHGYGENTDTQFIVRPYIYVDGIYYYGETIIRSHNDVA